MAVIEPHNQVSVSIMSHCAVSKLLNQFAMMSAYITSVLSLLKMRVVVLYCKLSLCLNQHVLYRSIFGICRSNVRFHFSLLFYRFLRELLNTRVGSSNSIIICSIVYSPSFFPSRITNVRISLGRAWILILKTWFCARVFCSHWAIDEDRPIPDPSKVAVQFADYQVE